MKREELKAYRPYANRDGFYHKSEADAVMDELEKRIKELEAAEYKWFDLVRDFTTVLGNDPYMVWTAIDSRLKLMCDNDEIERWNKLNQSILDRLKVLTPNDWNRTYCDKETKDGN